MRNQLPVRSTQFSFPISKCAIALLCCAFSIEPLFAQELDWPNYGNDVGNMRYANIDQITPANVSQLKPAWIFHTGVPQRPEHVNGNDADCGQRRDVHYYRRRRCICVEPHNRQANLGSISQQPTCLRSLRFPFAATATTGE